MHSSNLLTGFFGIVRMIWRKDNIMVSDTEGEVWLISLNVLHFFVFIKIVFEGWMQMRRPRFLSAQNRHDEPSSMYRNFVDTCYSGLCWLGLSPLVDTVASLG